MKKTVVFSVIALLVLFFGIGLYNASKLRAINIHKSIVIDAGRQKVFDQVVMLEKFPTWSPFYEADPSQTIDIKGVDGQVGAQYHWVGNNGEDVGYQEITKIDPFNYIRMQCNISKPFEARPAFEYAFKKIEDNKTQVTQNFELTSGLVDAFFMWMFDAKAEMEKMNARGMLLLKEACEK